MQLYSSKFCTIEYDSAQNRIKQTWKAETANMSNEEFKADQTKLAEFLNSTKPATIHTDAISFNFVISPDVQEWNAAKVLSTFAKFGGKKIGILIPPDIFAQVSIQQALDESLDAFATHYFEDETLLAKWLSE